MSYAVCPYLLLSCSSLETVRQVRPQFKSTAWNHLHFCCQITTTHSTRTMGESKEEPPNSILLEVAVDNLRLHFAPNHTAAVPLRYGIGIKSLIIDLLTL